MISPHILVADAAGAAGAGSFVSMILSLVILVGFMYFFMLRPQQKEQKKKNAMLAVGDTVLTTSGFYGTIIDISDDTVIVEFGSNKNCRIPMQRAAISVVEKPEDSANAVESKKDSKKSK